MKIVVRIIVALVVIAALLWFGIPLYLKRSVAQYDGSVRTKVAAPVEITFDAKGVPQIWAKTDGDAFFAMGWLHASERLFQMEIELTAWQASTASRSRDRTASSCGGSRAVSSPRCLARRLMTSM